MTVQREEALQSLGFRFGINGPHAARTMMLDEVRMLFSHIAPNAERSDFVEAIVEHNVLGKPTRKARELSLRYLTALYSLENKNPIYRALRRLWPTSQTDTEQRCGIESLAARGRGSDCCEAQGGPGQPLTPAIGHQPTIHPCRTGSEE